MGRGRGATLRRGSERVRPLLDAASATAALMIACGVGVIGVWQAGMAVLEHSERRHHETLGRMAASMIDWSALSSGVTEDEAAQRDRALTRELERVGRTVPAIRTAYAFVGDGAGAKVAGAWWADPSKAVAPDGNRMAAVLQSGIGAVELRPTDASHRRVVEVMMPVHDAAGVKLGGFGLELESLSWTSSHSEATRTALVGMGPGAVAALGFGLIVFRQRRRELMDRVRISAAQRVAEAASQAKSDFLANMSHEIRTPMTVVIGYAELLEDPELSVELRRQYVENIQRSGQHLVNLINDILDVAKIEAGKIEVRPVPCSPAEILSEIDSIMRQRAEAKRIRLEFVGLNQLPARIVSDPMRLRQILVNLVGNAIKFTEEGGVVVTAGFHRDELGARFEVRVVDSGIGIEPEMLRRLFKPFEQADASTTRKFGGTGLGLFITRRLATLLGGGVEVESAAGVGSTFTVWVEAGDQLEGSAPPALPPAALAPPEDSTAPPEPRLASIRRVLIADDGVENQRLISRILREAGVSLEVASSGSEALQAIRSAAERGTPFDVILMDLQMPDTDGLTATRLLRAMGNTTPIIACTAHATQHHRQLAAEAGCNGFLTKPFRRAELLAACQACLADRSPLRTSDQTAETA